MSQKVVKRHALTDFLADHLVPDNWELSDDFPGEGVFCVDVFSPWEMYFGGLGVAAGVVLVSPGKHILPYSFTLTQLCSNNMAAYKTLILGLQMVIEMGIKDLHV